jgi:hypothetical protein
MQDSFADGHMTESRSSKIFYCSTNFVNVKYTGYNIISRRHHVYSFLMNSISYTICLYIYDLSPAKFQTSSFNASLVSLSNLKLEKAAILCACACVFGGDLLNKSCKFF